MLLLLFWVLFLAASESQGSAKNVGVKFVVSHTSGNLTSEFTTYTIQDRRRDESRNTIGIRGADGAWKVSDPHENVIILRCDLGRKYALNTNAKEYRTIPLTAPAASLAEPFAVPGQRQQDPDESNLPTATVEMTTTDTGERQIMFGHLARHVIETVRQDGPYLTPGEFIIDGWYIDFDPNIACERRRREGEIKKDDCCLYIGMGGRMVPVAKSKFVEIGPRETGFALKQRSTQKGVSAPVYEFEVTEFVEGPLDPNLFEIPADYKDPNHIKSLPPG
jgi:hypothetical protein